MATLPWTLILYLWAVLVWQWYNRLCLSETCLKLKCRSKVPPNARCVSSYDFSTQKVNVQRKFTHKLLLFVATWPYLFDSSRTGFVWVRLVWNGSADPKSRQMRVAFRHTISQRKRWSSSGNSHTNCCCLWRRYESAKCDEVVPWIVRRKDWCLRRTKGRKTILIWQTADFYDSAIQKLVPRLNKYL